MDLNSVGLNISGTNNINNQQQLTLVLDRQQLPVDLRSGQIIMAKVKSLLTDNKALIEVNGQNIVAEVKIKLAVGQELLLEVKGLGETNQIQLQLMADGAKIWNQLNALGPFADIFAKGQIPLNDLHVNVATQLVLQGLAVNPKDIKSIADLLKKFGLDNDPKAVAAAVLLKVKAMPVNEENLQLAMAVGSKQEIIENIVKLGDFVARSHQNNRNLGLEFSDKQIVNQLRKLVVHLRAYQAMGNKSGIDAILNRINYLIEGLENKSDELGFLQHEPVDIAVEKDMSEVVKKSSPQVQGKETSTIVVTSEKKMIDTKPLNDKSSENVTLIHTQVKDVEETTFISKDSRITPEKSSISLNLVDNKLNFELAKNIVKTLDSLQNLILKDLDFKVLESNQQVVLEDVQQTKTTIFDLYTTLVKHILEEHSLNSTRPIDSSLSKENLELLIQKQSIKVLGIREILKDIDLNYPSLRQDDSDNFVNPKLKPHYEIFKQIEVVARQLEAAETFLPKGFDNPDGKVFYLPFSLTLDGKQVENELYFSSYEASNSDNQRQNGFKILFLLDTLNLGPIRISMIWQQPKISMDFTVIDKSIAEQFQSCFASLENSLTVMGYEIDTLRIFVAKAKQIVSQPNVEILSNIHGVDLRA